MSWVSRGENRWEWTLTPMDVHALVKVGDEMRELHGATLHVYRLGPSGLFPLEPLAGCEWVATHIVGQAFGALDEVFEWLENWA